MQIFYGGLSKKLICISAIGICSVLISFSIFQFDFFKSLELKAQDLLEKLSPKQDKSRDIAIVAIDNATINTLSWPITRDYYISLINILNEYNARTIVFDIAFIDENKSHPEWDTLLALTTSGTSLHSRIIHSFYFNIAESGSVLYDNDTIIEKFSISERFKKNIPKAISVDKPFPLLLKHTRRLGHFHLKPDRDGIFRRIPLLIEYNSRIYTGISLLAAGDSIEVDKPMSKKNSIYIKIKGKTVAVPIDKEGNMRIFYNGNGEEFETISLLELLRTYKSNRKTATKSPKLEKIISNKIILIGNTATALGDYAAIPANNNIPKVYIHANAISTIIKERFFLRLTPWKTAFILSAFLLLIELLSIQKKAITAAVIMLFIIACYCCTAFMLHIDMKIIPIGMPVTSLLIFYIGLTVYESFFKEKQVYLLESALGKYVSPKILERINAREKNLTQVKQEREITVLFSDIKGFSRLCNIIKPDLLYTQINEYLNVMSNIILQSGGAVDKFIGDGIMAYFDSQEQQYHAVSAINSALEMQKKVRDLNNKWHVEKRPKISIRIGINTGTVFIGDMGTERFSDYTLFGNEVNIAQRLESTAEPGTIYVSEATYKKAIDEFEYMNMGKISLKNIISPVVCYKVIARKEIFKGDIKD